jgi:hypothetical protein
MVTRKQKIRRGEGGRGATTNSNRNYVLKIRTTNRK